MSYIEILIVIITPLMFSVALPLWLCFKESNEKSQLSNIQYNKEYLLDKYLLPLKDQTYKKEHIYLNEITKVVFKDSEFIWLLEGDTIPDIEKRYNVVVNVSTDTARITIEPLLDRFYLANLHC